MGGTEERQSVGPRGRGGRAEVVCHTGLGVGLPGSLGQEVWSGAAQDNKYMLRWTEASFFFLGAMFSLQKDRGIDLGILFPQGFKTTSLRKGKFGLTKEVWLPGVSCTVACITFCWVEGRRL